MRKCFAEIYKEELFCHELHEFIFLIKIRISDFVIA